MSNEIIAAFQDGVESFFKRFRDNPNSHVSLSLVVSYVSRAGSSNRILHHCFRTCIKCMQIECITFSNHTFSLLSRILDKLREEGLLAKPKGKTAGGMSFEVFDELHILLSSSN